MTVPTRTYVQDRLDFDRRPPSDAAFGRGWRPFRFKYRGQYLPEPPTRDGVVVVPTLGRPCYVGAIACGSYAWWEGPLRNDPERAEADLRAELSLRAWLRTRETPSLR